MRQYFESQKDLGVVTYYLRVANPESSAPTELYVKTVSQLDIDVLASEIQFVEYIFHPKLGYSQPIFEKR